MKSTIVSLVAIGLMGALAGCETNRTGGDINLHVAEECGSQTNCYETIQGAVDAASAMIVDSSIVVIVAPGDYYEKVSIAQNGLTLKGAGPDVTRLHFDAVAQDARHYHRNNWGTAGSATLTINAVDVSVSGLRVENMFDYLSNDALARDDENKIRHSQAAALLLDIASDRVHMKNVHLTGYQDTLFLNGGRLFFEDGFISGNVDFIFGNGMGLFENSTIETRQRGKSFPEGEVQSYITAPSTQISQSVGLVFHKCRLMREEGVPDRSVTLGRPWHPTTRFADGRYADPKAIGYSTFIDTWMDDHIHENRWSTMGGTARDGSKADIFRPQDSRFSETQSSGPGARVSAIEIEWNSPLSYQDVLSVVFDDWALGE